MSSKSAIEMRTSAVWAAVIIASMALFTWRFSWGVIHGAINVYPFFAPGIEVWRSIMGSLPAPIGFALALLFAAIVQFVAVFAVIHTLRIVARQCMIQLRKVHDRVMADDI